MKNIRESREGDMNIKKFVGELEGVCGRSIEFKEKLFLNE
jgi:hypothetical protein